MRVTATRLLRSQNDAETWDPGRTGSATELLHGETEFLGPAFDNDSWNVYPAVLAFFEHGAAMLQINFLQVPRRLRALSPSAQLVPLYGEI
jgi:hypothetical protein